MTAQALNLLASRAVDAGMAVRRTVGPGLLESTYQACLLNELIKRGMHTEAQVPVPVVYDGELLAEVGYRMDLLVESQLVIELKAQENILPAHKAQLLSYLRHSGRRLGLLMNFHSVLFKDGVTRIVNGL